MEPGQKKRVRKKKQARATVRIEKKAVCIESLVDDAIAEFCRQQDEIQR